MTLLTHRPPACSLAHIPSALPSLPSLSPQLFMETHSYGPGGRPATDPSSLHLPRFIPLLQTSSDHPDAPDTSTPSFPPEGNHPSPSPWLLLLSRPHRNDSYADTCQWCRPSTEAPAPSTQHPDPAPRPQHPVLRPLRLRHSRPSPSAETRPCVTSSPESEARHVLTTLPTRVHFLVRIYQAQSTGRSGSELLRKRHVSVPSGLRRTLSALT